MYMNPTLNWINRKYSLVYRFICTLTNMVKEEEELNVGLGVCLSNMGGVEGKTTDKKWYKYV